METLTIFSKFKFLCLIQMPRFVKVFVNLCETQKISQNIIFSSSIFE